MPCSESHFSFNNSSGEHRASVIATDRAGNESESYNFAWKSDFDAPSVQITSTPSNPSGTSGLMFLFTGLDVHSSIKSYKCSVDGSSEQDCSSPFPVSSLGSGIHKFAVVAIDDFDNRSLPAEYKWMVDITAPSVSITSGPNPLTNSMRAHFQFEGSDNEGTITTFECRLDSGSYSPCSSGQSYNHLSPGDHTFYLRAQDNIGNTSAPTSYSWKIDTVAPTIHISQKPDSVTNKLTATFVWSLRENSGQVASRECFHNGQPINCSGLSHQLSRLTEGIHSFQIRVTDAAGNSGESTQYKWLIDTTPPHVTISSGPDSLTSHSNTVFTFSGTDTGSSVNHYQCWIDNLNSQACTSPQSYSGLDHGSHTFYVIVTDAAGNPSSRQSYNWVIDQKAPIIQFIQAPTTHPKGESAVVHIDVSDRLAGVASVQCGLDNTLEDCSPNQSQTLSDLNEGSHSFTVVATDRVGNTSTRSHSWDIIEEVLCDPFADNADDCPHGKGLLGEAYYLEHNDIKDLSFRHLGELTLDDYATYGHQIKPIHMDQVNVPLQKDTNGFTVSSGQVLQNQDGERLMNWFSVRLYSSLFPNRGSENQTYEFAILSDDGMRVLLDGEVILEDDEPHVPRFTCTQKSYEFVPFTRKSLEIHYFQGLPPLRAMQLFYRVADSGSDCPPGHIDTWVPPAGGKWLVIPENFFIIKNET